MSSSSSTQPSPQFGGGAVPFVMKKGVQTAVEVLERNAASMNTGKFVEDTLSSLGSRLLVSSSTAERWEIAPTEFLESVAVYFGLSGLAKWLAKPFSHAAGLMKQSAGKALDIFQPLTAFEPSQLAAAISARMATVLLPFGAMLVGVEGPLMYGKNMITTRLFGKGSFEGMLDLGLTGDSADTIASTENKVKRRLKQCAAGVLAIAAVAGGVVALGPRLLRNLKPEQLTLLAKRLSTLDLFSGGNGKAQLTKVLLGVYMGLSSLIYLDSSRGSNERKEILPRFGLIIGYLLFFKDLINKYLVFPKLENAFEGLVTKEITETGKIRTTATSLKVLREQPLFNALSDAAKTKVLRAKMVGFLVPYIVGTGLFSLVNTGMNRYFTRRRIAKQQQAVQQLVQTKIQSLQASHLQGTYLSAAFAAQK